MKHNFIAESLPELNLNSKFNNIFLEKSLITQIQCFTMYSDKQAGLLTNLPAKSTFTSLPASFFAVRAWKPLLDLVES